MYIYIALQLYFALFIAKSKSDYTIGPQIRANKRHLLLDTRSIPRAMGNSNNNGNNTRHLCVVPTVFNCWPIANAAAHKKAKG